MLDVSHFKLIDIIYRCHPSWKSIPVINDPFAENISEGIRYVPVHFLASRCPSVVWDMMLRIMEVVFGTAMPA